MAWTFRVSREDVAGAIIEATSWREVLDGLGYRYHGKNIATIRKWAARWGISTAHLSDLRGQRGLAARFTDEELAAAVAASYSWAETLRRLGYCSTGGNWKTLQRRVAELGIPTDHFDPYRATRERGRRQRIPLESILVEGSTYSRSSLKERLYDAGLKERRCELCGQDETWNGRRIGLIIDHINGVRDDNRIENLRIVCPNCAAGLDTHCGRKNRLDVPTRECERCGESFRPKYAKQRHCSVACGTRWKRPANKPLPAARKVARPPQATLLREVRALGYRATGRKYGVSDNAVRKWLRAYELEATLAAGREPDAIEIPTRTWPNQLRGRRAA